MNALRTVRTFFPGVPKSGTVRPALPAALLLPCLAASCGGGDGPPGSGQGGAPSAPHIVLVSIDTLRADHLRCYGYERETSPNLDALAAEGVRFERAVSSTSWTLPAHMTMLTGLPISLHGACDDRLWNRRDPGGERLPVPLRGGFVSEALQGAGYRTGGFHTWKYLEDQFGFGPGFEVWERHGHAFYSHPVVGPEFERLRAAGDVEGMKALAAEHPALFDESRPTTPEVTARALEWLAGVREETPDRPVFLFLHLFDVHDPYLPPAPWDRRFDPDYEGPIDGRRITSPDSPVRGDMAPRDLEHTIALYDGGIGYVDEQLGAFLDRVEELLPREDTLVVVTSDHGEEFFEHGHKTHRRQLYQESIAVPLIMRWPGGLPAGEVVEGTVGLEDVTPTLAAAAGASPVAQVKGTELLSIARGERENGPRTYLSLLYLFEGGAPVPQRHLSITRGDRQAVVLSRGAREERFELFDLAANPLGRGPGAPVDADDPLRTELDDLLARIRKAFPRTRDSLPARGADLPAMSELDERQLAAMGYTTGEVETEDAGERRLCLDGCVWPRD